MCKSRLVWITLWLATNSFPPPGPSYGQPASDDLVAVLVRKLGAANFRRRDAATNALMEHPNPIPALEKALENMDPEVCRRVKYIIHQVRERDLNAAVVGMSFKELLKASDAGAKVPPGGDYFTFPDRYVQALLGLHLKKGGYKISAHDFRNQRGLAAPPVVDVPKLTIGTKIDYRDIGYFVRAGEAYLDFADAKKTGQGNILVDSAAFFLVNGPFRNRAGGAVRSVILAEGSIDIKGESRNSIVVGAGDIKIVDPSYCLVIARGTVSCAGIPAACRIIAGKSVIFEADRALECIISENDPNPLGFIRWSDAPKDKVAPKTK